MPVLLDTNVVSELMLKTPQRSVLAWLDRWNPEGLYFSTVGESELRYGAELVKSVRRKAELFSSIERVLLDIFEGRILPFDRAAAHTYAKVGAMRRAAGFQISELDCQIAAIARTNAMPVATRNVNDFVSTGVEVINPWEES